MRPPDIGCFNDWTLDANAANRIGLKVIWEHQGSFYSKYEQCEPGGGLAQDYFSYAEGSLGTYIAGTALYAHFARGTWAFTDESGPPTYHDLGPAQVFNIQRDWVVETWCFPGQTSA